MQAPFECPWDSCSRSFDSKRGMKVHHNRQHGESIAGVEIECANCGDNFRVKESHKERRECCSNECYGAYISEMHTGENHPSWKGGDVTSECDNCGTEIIRDRGQYNRSKYHFCSKECEYEWKRENQSGKDHPDWEGKSLQTCSWCGDDYRDKSGNYKHTNRTFCSMDCFSKWCQNERVGENHPSWKGGYEGYYGPSWSQNRRKALKRDNHTCQSCKSDSDLHVHHIRPFREFGLENHKIANRLNNLITLCEPCHKKWEGIPIAPM